MFVRILIILSFTFSCTKKVENNYTQSERTCGAKAKDWGEDQFVKILNKKGQELRSNEVSATANGNQLVISEKACVFVGRGNHDIVIRGNQVRTIEFGLIKFKENGYPDSIKLLDGSEKSPVYQCDQSRIFTNQTKLHFNIETWNFERAQHGFTTKIGGQTVEFKEDTEEFILNLPSNLGDGQYPIDIFAYNKLSRNKVLLSSCTLILDRQSPKLDLTAIVTSANHISSTRIDWDIDLNEIGSDIFVTSSKHGSNCHDSKYVPIISFKPPSQKQWNICAFARDAAGNNSKVIRSAITSRAEIHNNPVEDLVKKSLLQLAIGNEKQSLGYLVNALENLSKSPMGEEKDRLVLLLRNTMAEFLTSFQLAQNLGFKRHQIDERKSEKKLNFMKAIGDKLFYGFSDGSLYFQSADKQQLVIAPGSISHLFYSSISDDGSTFIRYQILAETIEVFDVSSNSVIAINKNMGTVFNSKTLLHDSATEEIIYGYEGQINSFNLSDLNKTNLSLVIPAYFMEKITVSKNGVIASSGDRRGAIGFSKLSSSRPYFEKNAHREKVTDIAFNENYLYGISQDGYISRWHETGTLIAKKLFQTDPLLKLVRADDEEILAAGGKAIFILNKQFDKMAELKHDLDNINVIQINDKDILSLSDGFHILQLDLSYKSLLSSICTAVIELGLDKSPPLLCPIKQR